MRDSCVLLSMDPDVLTKCVTTSELFYKERDSEYSISVFLKQHLLGMFDTTKKLWPVLAGEQNLKGLLKHSS